MGISPELAALEEQYGHNKKEWKYEMRRDAQEIVPGSFLLYFPLSSQSRELNGMRTIQQGCTWDLFNRVGSWTSCRDWESLIFFVSLKVAKRTSLSFSSSLAFARELSAVCEDIQTSSSS